MRPKRKTAGEVRFRVSKDDLKRIDVLMASYEHESISSLLRTLIWNEYKKEIAKNGGKEKTSR